MADTAVGFERLANVEPEWKRPWPLVVRVVGAALALWAVRWFVQMVLGVRRARGAVADYETAHGPLPIADGIVAHQTDAVRALGETLAAEAGFLYPFGEIVLLGPLAVALIGSLLIWRNTLPVRTTIVAFGVSLATVIWAAPGTTEIIAVLE